MKYDKNHKSVIKYSILLSSINGSNSTPYISELINSLYHSTSEWHWRPLHIKCCGCSRHRSFTKYSSIKLGLGIKAVITTAYEAADLKYPSQIVPHHLFIEARDDYQFNLYDYFDSSVDWITKNLRMTNVLVHCIGGKSRSASLIIAYLIRERGMTRDDAISHMKSIRRQVKKK